MIARENRHPTPEEVAKLTRLVGPGRVPRRGLLASAVFFAVPGMLLAALVVSLVRNMHLLPAGSRWLVFMLLAVAGLFAAWFIWRAMASVVKAVLPTPKPKPRMSEAAARALTLTEVRFTADRQWSLMTADGDVAWELFQVGDQFVSLQCGALDDVRGADTGEPVRRRPKSNTTVVLDGESVLWITQSGAELEVYDDNCLSDIPRVVPDWCLAEFAVVTRGKLWPELVEEMGLK